MFKCYYYGNLFKTTNDWGSFSNFAASASTSSKTSALFLSSSLTTGISLFSLSDKLSTDMVKNTNVDYAAGSLCSSCSIPPHEACGL